MKHVIVCLFVGLLGAAAAKSAEPPMPLKDVPMKLESLKIDQLHKYKWVSVVQNGTNTESKDYGVLVVSSKFAKKKLQFHDTITLGASYNGTIFDRRLVYPEENLFAPEQATIDITGGGKTVHQLDYEKGKATFIEFSGGTNTQQWTFADGMLTFDALLRIVPLLPRDTGRVYTFQEYAEPFLFRTHKAEQKDGPYTISCEGTEKVTVGKRSYDCVRFRLDLKSADVRTDFWVGANNLVVKFVDVLPKGADASFLEATLQE
ncbi:MAG TPA: hypothetical protein VEH04_18315 [Verrucomicrobiae bacterium]|nr:hypothetical protein [Verrucomicrobiae bacterium]